MNNLVPVLNNPILVGMSLLLLIIAVEKYLTIKIESRIIPTNPTDIKIFKIKKNFLLVAVCISTILPGYMLLTIMFGS